MKCSRALPLAENMVDKIFVNEKVGKQHIPRTLSARGSAHILEHEIEWCYNERDYGNIQKSISRASVK